MRKQPGARGTRISSSPDGQERIIEMSQVLKDTAKFLLSKGLFDLAEKLPNEMKLSEEQIDLIKKKYAEGFKGMMVMPKSEDVKPQGDQVIKNIVVFCL